MIRKQEKPEDPLSHACQELGAAVCTVRTWQPGPFAVAQHRVKTRLPFAVISAAQLAKRVCRMLQTRL